MITNPLYIYPSVFIDHSVDVTIDEGWQGLQRLGLRSTVSFSRRQDGRVAMEGFPVYSTHQFQLWVLTVLLRSTHYDHYNYDNPEHEHDPQ